jgi:hypothetical protein
MTLDELVFLGACSILARTANNHYEGQAAAITAAVKTSKRVWEEVCDKRREDADGNS